MTTESVSLVEAIRNETMAVIVDLKTIAYCFSVQRVKSYS